MTAKKAKKPPKKDIREEVVEAALRLAAEKGWAQTGLRDIAAAADISLSDLRNYCEDKNDIFGMLARIVDTRVIESIGEIDESMSIRDRLFDVMMERFEILNDYREGVSAILDSFVPDPKQALVTFPMTCRSMIWMLEVAKVDTSGMKGAVRVAGLTGIYLKVLRDWKDDISPDLSRTMAALDRALGRADQLAATLML